MINTKNKDFKLRYATREDAELVLNFTKLLSVYENRVDEVLSTVELVEKNIFDKDIVKVIIGEYNGEPVGYAVYYNTYSTYLGRTGIYLEDLFIKEEFRGKGFGKIMISFVAGIAAKNECGRFEWSCLRNNENSLKFYKSLGGEIYDKSVTVQVIGENIEKLGEYYK